MGRISVEGGIIPISDYGGNDEGTFFDQWPTIRAWLPVWVTIFLTILTVQAIVIVIAMKALRHKVEQGDKVKTLIVLGSGGHTAEMLKLVESLDAQNYTPRAYVVATTDTMSAKKASDLELRRGGGGGGSTEERSNEAHSQGPVTRASVKKTPPLDTPAPSSSLTTDPPEPKKEDWELFLIPRSREVGQSYFSSVWTTLRSIYHALVLVWVVRPQVVLANGPGTCIPVCFAAVLYNQVAPLPCRVIYVESIARTRRLSLSGKILYRLGLADLILVQWEELKARCPRTKYVGRLY